MTEVLARVTLSFYFIRYQSITTLTGLWEVWSKPINIFPEVLEEGPPPPQIPMSSFMSFLTLGLTADAAAAHRHEFSSTSNSPVSTYHTPTGGSRTPGEGPILSPLTTIASESTTTSGSSSVSTPEREPTPKPKPRRTKTSYHLATPPPSHHSNRIHTVVRPSRALVLQLQRLHASTRPVPSFDVIPALAFSAKSKRKRLRSLGSHDFVILSSEEYTEDDDDEEEDMSSRNVIASISPVPKKDRDEDSTRALVEFPGGNVWEASQRANGSYEFICRQENGETLTARWVLRAPNTRRRSSQTVTPGKEAKPTIQTERKFQFSMINSNTRKHPILATMTGQRIDICDQYSVPTNACSRPSSPTSGSSRMDTMSTHSYSEVENERVLVQTEEHLKKLVIATGTWITLREGFNGRSWFDDTSLSLTPIKGSKPPTAESPLKAEKRSMDLPVQKITRRSTFLGRPSEEESVPSSPARRANSTGSALKRPVREMRVSKLGSTCDSLASTRASTPEPPAHQTSQPALPGNSIDTITPLRRSSPLSATPPQHPHSSVLDSNELVNDRPLGKNGKVKGDKWRRKSLAARGGGDGTREYEGEKRTIKQKISRVFNILRRNQSGNASVVEA